MAKLEVKNIVKTFPTSEGKKDSHNKNLVALNGVSFEVADKEFIAIVGPSGCGKTTLLRIISGLIKLDSGEILIDDTPVYEPRIDIGYVFQEFNLLPWKKAIHNVAFGLELQGYDKEERIAIAKKYIELLGLSGFESYYPYQLSEGMKQRVGLARALAINPKILLMDEPLGSIDEITREMLQKELLKILRTKKKTVVFVTHNLDEAMFLADRVLIMTQRPGKIKATMSIELPEPRWERDCKSSSNFYDYRIKLSKFLYDKPSVERENYEK